MSIKLLVVSVVLALLSGCALKNNPVPLGDSELVGYWFHEGIEAVDGGQLHTRMAVDIKMSGYISYHFISCFSKGKSKSQSKMLDLGDVPIIRVTTKKIKAQTFPLTPKWEFQIGMWPREENGKWLMELDKRELTKLKNSVDTSRWVCK